MKRAWAAGLMMAVAASSARAGDVLDTYGTMPDKTPTIDGFMPLFDVSPAEASANAPSNTPRPRSYELPVSVERKDTTLKEEELVGSYNQPRWTTARLSTRTRIYVIPEGKVEMEYWAMPRWHNNSSEVDIRQLAEVEVGLGHRLQLDLYFRTDTEVNTHDDGTLVGGQFEIRYAFANWGELPGNPTFYFEWQQLEHRSNRIEPKLLFGGELAPGWHWGANFICEREVGKASKGEAETELEFTGVLMYSVLDNVFSAGVEVDIDFSNVRGERSDWFCAVLVGPSFRWKPVPPMTINFCPLLGITDESPDARVILNIGWEF